jgi:hypothetical protein
VIRLARSGCRRHRTVLVDFLDRGERLPGLDAAFDHVDRCNGCRRDLESAALTIAALRRVGRAIATAEPSVDAWPRLRDRLAMPSRPALPGFLHVGGLVLSAWIVAFVSAPSLIGTNRSEPWRLPVAAGGGSALGHRDDARIRALSEPLVIASSVIWIAPDGHSGRSSVSTGSGGTIPTVTRR